MSDVSGVSGSSGTRFETRPTEAPSEARQPQPPTDTGTVEAAAPPPPVEPTIPPATGAIDYGLAKSAAGTMGDNVGVDFGHIAALMMQIDSELARAARDEQVAQIESVAHEMHASARDIRASARMALIGGVISGGAQIGAAGVSMYGGIKGMQLTNSVPVLEAETSVPEPTTTAKTPSTSPATEEPKPVTTGSGESSVAPLEDVSLSETGQPSPSETQTRQVRQETTEETVKEVSTAKQKAAATRLDHTLSQQLSARAHSVSLATQGLSQLTVATGDIIKTAMEYESRMKDADSKQDEARAEEKRAYLDRTKGFADSMQKGAQDMLSIFQQMEDSMHQTHKTDLVQGLTVEQGAGDGSPIAPVRLRAAGDRSLGSRSPTVSQIVNDPGQVGPNVPGVAARETVAARGSFRGEQVQHVRNPTAELQDAAEELTFGESERVEKKLSQRKLKSGAGIRSTVIEQAEKYLRDVPDLEKKQKLSDFAKSILEQGRPPGQDDLRERARKFSDDPTHQFLALEFSREQAAAGDADPALIEALDDAMAALQAESGPAIRAGLNVSPVARQYADRNVGDMQQLRDIYRDIVLDCQTINDAYERVVADHPGKSFDEAVRFMLKALGAELAASTRSVSKVRIKQIVDDMYQLKSLNSVHEQCEDLVQRVRGNFGAKPGADAARDLVSELLTAQDRAWQGADAFAALPRKMGVQRDDAGIYVLQGFKELVRFVPLKAFGDDMAKRDRVMISVQQALDAAIDNEEFDD